MGCDILDVRCVIVNEVIGSVSLSVILAAVFYFIMASKMKLGFDTTITFAVPFVLAFGVAIAGFSAIYAFLTFLGGLLLALSFQRLIGNK